MLLGANIIAFLLALALPLVLFVSRSVVRSQRGAAYNDLISALYPEGDDKRLPQLEVIRSKYATGVSGTDQNGIPNARRDPPSLMLTAILFAGLSFLGFSTLIIPEACQSAAICDVSFPAAENIHFALTPAYLWQGGPQHGPSFEHVIAIAAVAFLGAYIQSAQYLIRQLLNYELGGVAFLRAAFQLFLGVVVATVAYRALSPVLTGATDLLVKPAPHQGFAIWLGAAFLIGLSPQAGLTWIGQRLKLTLQKEINLDSLQSARITPIEVIDGIDSATRFRLEENNIQDVQNLATRNPVELYIETPFGLMEVFDWVLQAQLCTAVGAQVFVELKRNNIRTIFDLERAVLADGAPPEYVLAIGAVLYARSTKEFRAHLSFETDGSAKFTVESVRHAVAMMCDDLHVHRLRALWSQMRRRSMTAEDRRWLYSVGILPGDEIDPIPSEISEGRSWLGVAAAAGRKYQENVRDPAAPAMIELRRDALDAIRRALRAEPDLLPTIYDLWRLKPLGYRGRSDLSVFNDDLDFRALLAPMAAA